MLPSLGKSAGRTQVLLKRFIDVFVAAALLVLLGPFLLLIGLAIRLSSPGPALYRQRRLRQYGEEFTMLKFRTMVDGADGRMEEVLALNHASGPLFKSSSDPRRTTLGRVLRSNYIDELPQLINVLMGEMALVGPRPCLARELEASPDELAFRLAVPQGMTGPWQTNGHHGVSFEEMVTLEREYVDRWTLGVDVKILARTIPLVIRRTGF